MDVLKERGRLQRENDEISSEFVQIELDLAITFCDTALHSDGDKRQRNLRYARSAYSSARKFGGRIENRGRAYEAMLDEKLERLAVLFDQVARTAPHRD